MRLLALADDLTGALEVGAKLGAPVRLFGPPLETLMPEVLVINTESRHLDPAHAAQRVRDTVAQYRPELIFKKTDSTLRGNIGPELGALGDSVIFVPAYPELGRIVRGGHLYVDGQPLHQTPFAHDPHHPARSSSVAQLLGEHAAAIRIHDAGTEAEVERIVLDALTRSPAPVLCGPANVAGYLGRALGLVPAGRGWRKATRCLVVNGSLHRRSAEQMEYGLRQHWPGWSFIPEGYRATLPAALDTLIVFGGDTAFAILEAIGWSQLMPLGEIAPGVPVSRTGDLQLVTKAGGFGPVDVLTTIKEAL